MSEKNVEKTEKTKTTRRPQQHTLPKLKVKPTTVVRVTSDEYLGLIGNVNRW